MTRCLSGLQPCLSTESKSHIIISYSTCRDCKLASQVETRPSSSSSYELWRLVTGMDELSRVPNSQTPLPCLVDGPVSQSHSPPPLRCELRLLLALWARWLMGLLTLPLTTGAGGGPTSERCCVDTVLATEAGAGCLLIETSGPNSVQSDIGMHTHG